MTNGSTPGGHKQIASIRNQMSPQLNLSVLFQSLFTQEPSAYPQVTLSHAMADLGSQST
jgi:hypothetical protein